LEDIINSLSTYGYVVLFAYSFGGGMVALIAAGVLSYAGKMDLATSMAVAFASNVIGSTFLFYMGRYNRKAFMPYIKTHRRKLALAHIMMKKYGDKIVFIQKFVYGLKTLIPIAISLTRYPATKFHVLNIISAVLWTLIIGFGSYSAGEALMKGYAYLSQNPILAPIVLFSILGLIWFYLQSATKKRS